MAGLILVVALLAASPILSQVITVKVSTSYSITGSIVVGAVAPSDSQLFSDDQEVLASINTANADNFLCQLGMNTILTRTK